MSARFAHLLTLVALALPAVAASMNARANTELDRRYGLETIGALRSIDNVDNLFADYVAAAYKDYFANQTRFRLQDLSKSDPFFNKSKLPYTKITQDTAILSQLARVTRSDSLLRTKILKEGAQYQVSIDWLHAPAMDLIATQSFALGDAGGKSPGLGDIKSALQKGLDGLFAKVPFLAHVTGRDNNTVTVNMGTGLDLKQGDALMVGTLDEVKKHPLLHTIVEWRLSPTGKLEVDQVEDSIAFCHVVQEEEGRKIARYQKITQVLPKPVVAQPLVIREQDDVAAKLLEPPHLGWASGSLFAGSFSRQFGNQAGSAGVSGSGLLLGGRADGELWFTREFFADLGVAYGTFGYSQTDIAVPAVVSPVSDGGTMFSLKVAMGFSYTVTPDFFGPKGWLKLGYHSTSYSLPVVAASFVAPFSTKSLFVGLGGDLPIRAGFGAKLDLEYALYASGSETGSTAGDIGSTHNASVYIGGYYRFKPRITFMAGFYIEGASADYPTGNSLSHKMFTFVPSVLYYF